MAVVSGDPSQAEMTKVVYAYGRQNLCGESDNMYKMIALVAYAESSLGESKAFVGCVRYKGKTDIHDNDELEQRSILDVCRYMYVGFFFRACKRHIIDDRRLKVFAIAMSI